MYSNPQDILKHKLCKNALYKQDADIAQIIDAYNNNNIGIL